MARQVVWTYPARADFLAALEYLFEKSPQAATDFFDRVDAAATSLEQFPERGRIVREVESKNRREIYVQSYRLFYRVEKDAVTILRLIHGRQDFSAALKREPK